MPLNQFPETKKYRHFVKSKGKNVHLVFEVVSLISKTKLRTNLGKNVKHSNCFTFYFGHWAENGEIGSVVFITLFAISRVVCVLGAVTVLVIFVVVLIKIIIIIVEVSHVDIIVCGRLLLGLDAIPRNRYKIKTCCDVKFTNMEMRFFVIGWKDVLLKPADALHFQGYKVNFGCFNVEKILTLP